MRDSQIVNYSYSFSREDQTLRVTDKSPVFSVLKDGVCIDEGLVREYFENVGQLLFEVTEKCNFNCSYCGYGTNYHQPEIRPLHTARYLQWNTAKELIDYFIRIWKRKNEDERHIVIGFYGGEPLLNFVLIEKIVDYLIDNKPRGVDYSWVITTNGYFVKKHLDFLLKHQFVIDFSLDGDRVANRYRVFKNGKETFSHVISTLDYIFENHPDFFKKQVSIQSVINHTTTVIDVTRFFWDRYGIVPRIIEMSTKNVSCEKEIKRMYRNVTNDLEASFKRDSSLFEQMGINSPVTSRLLGIIQEFSSYYYKTYEDLLSDEKTGEHFLYSSTCLPFFSRLFLTSSGYIFPCEKVNYQYPLGRVLDSGLSMDFGYVAKLYSSMYTCLQSLCPKCLHQFNCRRCFMQDGGFDENRVRCEDFILMNDKNILKEIEYLKRNHEIIHLAYQ